MTQWTFANVYTLSARFGTPSDYTISEVSTSFPTKQLTDDQDGNADGVVADGDPLTLYLHPLTFNATLVGLGPVDGVAVYSASNNKTYFLTDNSYQSGDVVTLTDGTLTHCFAAGTLIGTPTGERAVEALQPGDPVLTADGRTVPVRFVFAKAAHKLASGHRMQPVRISAQALGPGQPFCDLLVTGDHALVVGGHLVNASALVNGHSIDWVPMDELPDRMTYYHVETEHHEAILANGAPAESFADMGGRTAYDNFAEYLALHGTESIIPEMPLPRVASQRLLPQAVRQRLAIPGTDWMAHIAA